MREIPPERARVGVGTLVVFLSMVLVASVAAGVLINTTGVFGATSGQAADAGGADRLAVVGSTGSAVAGGSVGLVNLTVAAGPGAEAVDLRNVTVTWVGPGGAYNVVHAGASGAADGQFRATALGDPDGSVPALSDGDRAVLTFDLGTDDAAGLGEFGERLRAGDVVTVTLATETGAGATTRLAVPRSLSDGSVVVL